MVTHALRLLTSGHREPMNITATGAHHTACMLWMYKKSWSLTFTMTGSHRKDRPATSSVNRRPTYTIRVSSASGLWLLYTTMVKSVLQELKQDASAAMKLLSIAATMTPFQPCGSSLTTSTGNALFDLSPDTSSG